MRIKPFVIFATSFFLLCLSSCGSSKKSAARSAHNYDKGYTYGKAKTGGNIADTDLVNEAKTWLGTPYRYGGKDKGRGTDCSGFVMEVYRSVTSIKLPRTTVQQRNFCEKVRYEELKPGDLVFFSSSSGKVNHVGMYVGAGQIIHASSSRGVIFSSMNEKYYAKNYHSSGRVRSYKFKETRQPDKKAAGQDNSEGVRQTDMYEVLDNAIEQRIDSIYSNLLD